MLGLCSKLALANNTGLRVSLLLHDTNMDPGPEQVLGRRPETGRVGEPTEASTPSSDSSEPSSRLTGSKRRRKPAATPPGSDPPSSGTRTSVRVLRTRSASADGTSGAKNAANKPDRQQRMRVPPVELRPRNTPAMRTVTVKKTKAKKASKPTLRPKLSKSRRGKPRSPASSRTRSPEAEKEAPVFGDEMGVMQKSSENVAGPGTAMNKDPSLRDHPEDVFCKPETKTRKTRQRTCTTSQAKDVKKEESEEGKDEIKEEELREIGMQTEGGEDNNTAQPSRKRGRQQKVDKGPRQPKQRKKPPVQYVRCEIEGCGTVLAHPRYLQHHIKYQHLLKKKYVCSHPSCGRLFRLQKQLLRHAKHHTDQRDYICEYCARAFKSAHNLAVHRMIHTGEKPIQCEICGFTCRQKASLNWHMKKHDAEASYQFSCSICGKKFEKKDSVNAHKAKSHPEVLIAEALAANGGAVISSPISETAPAQTNQTSLSLENQEEAGDSLALLHQVVLPLSPQAPVDAPQGQCVQLTTLPAGHVTPQEQAPALLQFTAATPAPVSSNNQPQLIQLSTFPASNVTSMATMDSRTTLLTLNSVTTLASTDILAPQQAVQWNREASEGEIPGEAELWDRVIVGEGHQDVGGMTWGGNCRMKKEDEGIVWEREGERQIVLQCSDVHGDSLM